MGSEQTPEALIRGARAGRREAFDQLAAGLSGRLRGLVQTRVGSFLRQTIEVDDVVQETLLRAFRSIARYRGNDPESFLRWLGGIANHVIFETARRHRRELLIALEDETAAPGITQSKESQRQERFDRLQRALDTLSPDHRKVILLARVERLPMAEVARKMDRTPEAASQLLWRALKKLKEAFGNTDSYHLPPRQLEDRGTSDEGQ